MTLIALLPGDGVGPGLVAHAETILRLLLPHAEFQSGAIGFGAWQETGASLPESTVELVSRADATLFGAVTTPTEVQDYRSPVLALRQRFELYANLRPARSVPHPCSRPGGRPTDRAREHRGSVLRA